MSADAKAGPTVFTKEMVEKTILFFNDTKRVPDGDQAGMEELIGAFVRFEGVVRAGNVAPGEATALAREFLALASRWFQQNPAYAEIYRRLKAQLGA